MWCNVLYSVKNMKNYENISILSIENYCNTFTYMVVLTQGMEIDFYTYAILKNL